MLTNSPEIFTTRMMVTCCIFQKMFLEIFIGTPICGVNAIFLLVNARFCWSIWGCFFVLIIWLICAPVSVGSSQYLSNMPNDSGYPLVI